MTIDRKAINILKIKDDVSIEMLNIKELNTENIKKALANVGIKHDLQIASRPVEGFTRNWTEWLWDFTLYTYYQTKDWCSLKELILVAESELNSNENELRVDFEKLIVSRAYIKVMVFRGLSETINRQLAIFEKIISKFHGSSNGDTYLFFGWNNGEEKWIHREYIYHKS